MHTRKTFSPLGACMLLITACASSEPPAVPTTAPSSEPAHTDTPPSPEVDVAGPWHGAIDAGAMLIDIDVEFVRSGDGLSGTLDVPQQGLQDLPLSNIQQDANRFAFEATLPGDVVVSFDGTLEDGELSGTYKQGGATTAFTLDRGKRPARTYAQSSEHFDEEDVTFESGDVRLAGTLTLPKGVDDPPVAVLVSGSGPQDRNEEVLGFRVFEALAHGLAERGIAVLRYDDRGVGQSTGTFESATTMNFADDAAAAVAYLKTRGEVDATRIGIIGHSEGATVAPLVATRDADVAYLVLLAPVVQPFAELLHDQNALVGKAEGMTDEQIAEQQRLVKAMVSLARSGADEDTAKAKLAEVCEPCKQNPAHMQAAIAQVQSPWMRFLLEYDPKATLAKVDDPVLALFGSLDRQVPPDRNMKLLREATKGHGAVVVEKLDGVNHVLQTAKTGAASEYATLPKELDPRIVPRIAEWIAKQG